MPKESKTNRQIIEDLHRQAGIKKVGIRSIKRDLKEGRGPQSAVNITEETKKSHKVEINALTAILIEDIWVRVLEVIKADSGSDRYLLIENAYREYSDTIPRTSRQIATHLEERTADFLKEQLDLFLSEREDQLKHVIDPDHKDNTYSRFKNLVDSPNLFLLRGINTAVKTMWDIISILPSIYQRQFGKPIPITEFEKLARNSIQLIYNLASSHLYIFSNIDDQYTKTPEFNVSFIDRDAFQFKDTSGNLTLELKPSVLRDIELLDTPSDPRTGCPAIFSIGPSHRNVIAEMHSWVIDLAKKYYLPALEKEQKDTT